MPQNSSEHQQFIHRPLTPPQEIFEAYAGEPADTYGPGNMLGRVSFELLAAHYQATHDALTGALNRNGLEEFLASSEPPVAVLMVDADQFGMINKRLGMERGDEIIVGTADVLRQSIRPNDKLVRLGGDEFMILLVDDPRKDKPKRRKFGPTDLIAATEGRIAENTKLFLQQPVNSDIAENGIFGFGMSVGGAVWQKGMTVNALKSAKETADAILQVRKAAKKTA